MPDNDIAAQPVKRSVSLQGHRTSVTLEPVFWSALETMASGRQRSLAGLIAEIDAQRPPGVTLTSALRCHILAWALQEGGDQPAS